MSDELGEIVLGMGLNSCHVVMIAVGDGADGIMEKAVVDCGLYSL